MRKIVFGTVLLVVVVLAGCTQYVYVPGDLFPWYGNEEEEEVFVPNVNSNEEFKAALSEIKAGEPVELRLAQGTYSEQIVLPEGADVTIIGEGEDTTILSVPEGTTTLDTISAYGSETQAYTGTLVAQGGSITLKNLTVESNPSDNYQIATNTGARFCTFAVIDSSVYAENVTFTGSRFDGYEGMQNGTGIYIVGNGNDVTFKNCTVSDFNKTGIVVREGVGSFSFVDGTVQGMGSTGITAQNGIQTACLDSTISGNVIKDIDYTGTSWLECGIMLQNASFTGKDFETVRDNNTFENCPQKCTISPISAPTGFSAVKDTEANTITFTWTPSTTETVTGYWIYDSEYNVQYFVDGSATSSYVLNLADETEYTNYDIYAHDEFGFSSTYATCAVGN